MRRLSGLLLALGLVSNLAGCYHTHHAGLCDCDNDDPCCNRAPWIKHPAYYPGGPVGEVPVHGQPIVETRPAQPPVNAAPVSRPLPRGNVR